MCGRISTEKVVDDWCKLGKSLYQRREGLALILDSVGWLNKNRGTQMIKFAFLKLFPCGWGSGNLVLKECLAASKAEAVKFFQQTSPIALDGDGYGKQGEFSYCVAECY